MSRPYSRTHNFCSLRIWLCAHTSPWLENSVRMSKVGVPVGSIKTHLTQLKVATLVSDIVCTVPQDNNSRSGALPLSLHHSSQKVNLSCKNQNQKREEKSQESHHQDSNPDLPTSQSKAPPLVQLPTPLQGAPREWRSGSIFSGANVFRVILCM